MGFSCSAIHIHFDFPTEVAAALRTVVQGRAFVSESLRGWISIYDAASEQDFEAGKRLAAQLSARFQALALMLDLYDDAVTRYALFANGELADEFSSCPDYFGPGSAPPAAGDPRILERYGKAGNTLELYESLLRPMDLARLPEEDRLRGIARAFGIATTRAMQACSSLSPAQEKKLTPVHATGDAAATKKLVNASRFGDIEVVRALLERRVMADSKDVDGTTAIERAVEGGHLAILRLLLERPLPSGPVSAALFWAVVPSSAKEPPFPAAGEAQYAASPTNATRPLVQDGIRTWLSLSK